MRDSNIDITGILFSAYLCMQATGIFQLALGGVAVARLAQLVHAVHAQPVPQTVHRVKFRIGDSRGRILAGQVQYRGPQSSANLKF